MGWDRNLVHASLQPMALVGGRNLLIVTVIFTRGEWIEALGLRVVWKAQLAVHILLALIELVV